MDRHRTAVRLLAYALTSTTRTWRVRAARLPPQAAAHAGFITCTSSAVTSLPFGSGSLA